MRPMAPILMNLHVKSPIFSAKDEDVESHFLCNHDWMNLQDIAEDVKCGRYCLTLGDDACLWYDSMTPLSTDWNNLKKTFS